MKAMHYHQDDQRSSTRRLVRYGYSQDQDDNYILALPRAFPCYLSSPRPLPPIPFHTLSAYTSSLCSPAEKARRPARSWPNRFFPT